MTNSAQALYDSLDVFEYLSGLKVSGSKTEGLWIGSLKYNDIKRFGIKWPDEPIKALGAFFTYYQNLRAFQYIFPACGRLCRISLKGFCVNETTIVYNSQKSAYLAKCWSLTQAQANSSSSSNSTSLCTKRIKNLLIHDLRGNYILSLIKPKKKLVMVLVLFRTYRLRCEMRYLILSVPLSLLALKENRWSHFVQWLYLLIN